MMELEKMKAQLAAAKAEEDAKREAEKAEARRLDQLQAAVEAEEKRLNSKAYKDALKRIQELEIEAGKRKQAAIVGVDELMEKIEAWESVCDERRRLAHENRVDAKDLKAGEIGKLLALKFEIFRWKKFMQSLESMAKIGLGEVKPVHKKRALGKTEHEKMMAERYPDR